VKLASTPAVTVAGKPTSASVAAGPGLTVMVSVTVSAGLTVSVAVIVELPSRRSVTLKACAPRSAAVNA
jgi:hypothetical protein